MESDKVYNVTVQENGNIAVTVSTVATVEVSENAVNIGGGAEVYKGLVGADVQFRTFTNTDGDITITQTDDAVEINLDSNITADLVGNSTGTHFGDVVGGNLSVNSIQASSLTTSGNIVPAATNTFTLGTPTNVWKDVYLGNASLYIDGTKVLGSDITGDIDITTDPNQSLNIQAGNDIYLNPNSGTINIDATDINLGPSTGGTTVDVTGTLNASTSLKTDALEITGTKIDQTGGQSLEIKTGPAAYIHQNTSDVYVGSFTQAAHITPTSISAIGNALNITGNFTGDVLGNATQAENLDNHSTDDLIEGSINQYYTDAKVDARIPSNVSSFINDSGYITSSALTGYALQSYVDQEISNLIDTAPATLDTLNELAAALGDDPNFATTVTNQIAAKFDTSAFTSTADSWLATKTTTNLTEGTNLYYTDARFDNRLALKTTTDLTEGVNLYYTDTRARNAISLSTTNNSELSYDPNTGVFSYVSPTTVTAANAVEMEVLNNTGATLTKGTAVYISGHTGSDITVALAQNDVAGQYPAIGLVAGAITNNTSGFIITQGELVGIDTSAFSVGQVLYLSSTPGVLTNVRPSSAAHAVQNIGKVARSHPTDGIIIISGSGRANDVPNLDHLEVFIGDTVGYQKRQLDASDLSDINNTNPQAGDVLTWDAVNLEYTPQAPTGGSGGGIALTDLSVTQNAVGTAALTYDNLTGVFSYTPPDLSGYSTLTLADFSVTQLAPSGGGSLTYNNTTGVLSYTSPDLSGYLTSETDTLQSVTNRGAATTNTCIVPFYYADQASFPNATTYHGALAHSHADGAVYFAHASAWVELSNKADVDTALGDIDTALTTILGS